MKYWEVVKTNKTSDGTTVSINVVDKEYRNASVWFKWDGCVDYHKFENGFTVDDKPSKEKSETSQYIHICELDEMIERLQEIKKIAEQYFNKKDFETYYKR
jgi:hypothetical protein